MNNKIFTSILKFYIDKGTLSNEEAANLTSSWVMRPEEEKDFHQLKAYIYEFGTIEEIEHLIWK